ncbi:hypothetical protein ACXR2W_00805 [Leucobacter sp. HY1908]
MLKASDLAGVDSDLATAVIAVAVTEAPCLDRLPASDAEGDLAELRNRAIVTLKQVALAAARRGDALVRSQRIGAAGVDYGSVGTAFSADHWAALRGVCAALCGGRPAGMPVGRFPDPGVVADAWPERGR